ncbi:MAG: VanZ family protein [Elusimicrobiota bacterium]
MILILAWLPVFCWAGLIFWFSSIPSLNSGLGNWDFYLRKGAHVFEFFVLTGFIYRALKITVFPIQSKRIYFYSFLSSLLYAFADEWHQAFVPGRGPSLSDVLFDSVGIILMLIFIWIYHNQRRWKK